MIEWLKLHKHIETRGERDFESDYAQGCLDGYSYAEMHFESMVCGKCIKWESINEDCGNCTGSKYRVDDEEYNMITVSSFGCNEFMGKQDDEKATAQ